MTFLLFLGIAPKLRSPETLISANFETSTPVWLCTYEHTYFLENTFACLASVHLRKSARPNTDLRSERKEAVHGYEFLLTLIDLLMKEKGSLIDFALVRA